MFGAPLWEITGRIRRLRSSRRLGLLFPLSPSSASGRLRGRPGLPTTGGMPSTRARACVTSLTLAAVVMTILAEGSLSGWEDAEGAFEITRDTFERIWLEARHHLESADGPAEREGAP